MRYKPKHIEKVDAVLFDGANRQEVIDFYNYCFSADVVRGRGALVSHEKIMSFIQPLFEFYKEGYFLYYKKNRQMAFSDVKTFMQLWQPDVN